MTIKSEGATYTTHMVKRIMIFCNAFSIVVVSGAVSTSFFFSYYWGVNHEGLFYWLLGSSVWLIYTLDHLLDAFRLGPKASSIRHRLHHQFRYPLIILVFFIAGFNAMEVWLNWNQFPYIRYGVVLIGLFILYLIYVMLHHKQGKHLNFKEIWVAIFATIGMALSPVFGQEIQPDTGNFLLLAIFTLLNFLNLLTFSRFDLRQDQKDKMQSLACHLGFPKTSRWINNLLAVAFLMTVVWLFTDDWPYKITGTLALIVMINILALINLKYVHFRKDARYRFWGDLIYLIPGLVVFLKL